MRKPLVFLELAIVLVICMLTQGCLGVFVHRAKTRTIEGPGVEAFAAEAPTEIKEKLNPVQPAGPKDQSSDVEHVRAHQKSGHTQRWTFPSSRTIWCGVVIGVIVPIPLVLPVTKESATYFIRDGELTKVKLVEYHLSGLGFAGSPEGGFESIAQW